MVLSQADLLQIQAALKPVIVEMVDDELRRVQRSAAEAKKAAADKMNPRSPESEPERYSRGRKLREAQAAATTSTGDVERRLERLERERYQRTRANSELAAEIAAGLVTAARGRGETGEETDFAMVHRRILAEIAAAPQVARERYSKQISKPFAGISTAPPPEPPSWAEQLDELVKARAADHAVAFSSERVKLLNAIFGGLCAGKQVAAIVQPLAGDHRETAKLTAIVQAICKEADKLAKKKMAHHRVSVAVAFRMAYDELYEAEKQRHFNEKGGDWHRGQLDWRTPQGPRFR